MIVKTRKRLKRISERIFSKSINSCLLPLIICAVIMVIFQHENQTQRPANAASRKEQELKQVLMQALKELAADKIDAKDRDSYHLDDLAISPDAAETTISTKTISTTTTTSMKKDQNTTMTTPKSTFENMPLIEHDHRKISDREHSRPPPEICK